MKIVIKKKANIFSVNKMDIIFVVFLSVINSEAVYISSLSFVISIIELIIVSWFLIKRKYTDFLLYTILFLGTAMENPFYATGSHDVGYYAFTNMPWVSMYHLIVLFFVADIHVFPHLLKICREHTNTSMLLRKYWFLFASGIVFFLLILLANDNGIFEYRQLISYSVRDIYYAFTVVSIIMIAIYCLNVETNCYIRMEQFIYAYLFGMVISACLIILLGNYYFIQYGASKLLTCPLGLMFTPFVVLFVFYEKYRMVGFVLGLLSIVIQTEYTLGIAGTWWLLLSIIAVMVIVKFFPNTINLRSIARFIVGGILVYLVLSYLRNNGLRISGNYQINYKLESIKMLFDIKGNLLTWYANLGESVQSRIDEFVNVLFEYGDKPWFLIFGKGYGGNIRHWWGYSRGFDIALDSFSSIQIETGIFSTLHTGFAEYFINHGLYGLVVQIWLLVTAIRAAFSKKGNIWLFVGVWDIIIFTGFYSLHIGILMICLGMFLLDKRKGMICGT